MFVVNYDVLLLIYKLKHKFKIFTIVKRIRLIARTWGTHALSSLMSIIEA